MGQKICDQQQQQDTHNDKPIGGRPVHDSA
jgi:hypothetical protein